MYPNGWEEKGQMDNTPVEVQQELIQSRQHTRRNSLRNIIVTSILLILSLSLWGSLLYGGYWLANQYINESRVYIDTKVEQIEEQNQQQIENVKALQTELDKVHEELINIKDELVYIQEYLALTGETLNGTDKTKEALDKRIDQLNAQLSDLQASIQRLEDAAND